MPVDTFQRNVVCFLHEGKESERGSIQRTRSERHHVVAAAAAVCFTEAAVDGKSACMKLRQQTVMPTIR